MRDLYRKLKFWLKDRIVFILDGGKCFKCGGKLHLNKLGFHNCGKCFTEIMAKELGEDPNDWK